MVGHRLVISLIFANALSLIASRDIFFSSRYRHRYHHPPAHRHRFFSARCQPSCKRVTDGAHRTLPRTRRGRAWLPCRRLRGASRTHTLARIWRTDAPASVHLHSPSSYARAPSSVASLSATAPVHRVGATPDGSPKPAQASRTPTGVCTGSGGSMRELCIET